MTLLFVGIGIGLAICLGGLLIWHVLNSEPKHQYHGCTRPGH